MSLIHIARHSQQLGTFNEDDVREGMNLQRFFGEDLVWKQGMTDWKPLSEMAVEWGFDAATLKAAASDGATPPLLVPLPWEKRSEIGFFKAFFQTLRAVLFFPKITFSRMETTGGFAAPLFYYVIVASTVFTMTVLLLLPAVLKNPGVLAPQLATFSQKAILAGFAGVIVVAPLLFIVGIFLSSFIAHMSLKILGATKKPFRATFRVLCYSFGSTSLFQLIPLVGGILGALWGLTLYFIGLKEVYSLSKWRAFFVIVVSVALYLLLVVMLVLLFSFFHTSVPVVK